MSWDPIGHKPPLPRIETSPKREPEPQIIPPHLQVQIEHAERMDRLAKGERVWKQVVDAASGCGPAPSDFDRADGYTLLDPEKKFDRIADEAAAAPRTAWELACPPGALDQALEVLQQPLPHDPIWDKSFDAKQVRWVVYRQGKLVRKGEE